jgi:hypothetical protein
LKREKRISEESYLCEELFDKTKNIPLGKLKLDVPNYVMVLVLREDLFLWIKERIKAGSLGATNFLL